MINYLAEEDQMELLLKPLGVLAIVVGTMICLAAVATVRFEKRREVGLTFAVIAMVVGAPLIAWGLRTTSLV